MVLDLDRLRDVTFADPDLMREIVRELIDDTARQMLNLHEAIAAADPKGCERAAHSSKGACANVGATGMAEVLREIETEARAGKLSDCAERMSSLEREMESLRREADWL